MISKLLYVIQLSRKKPTGTSPNTPISLSANFLPSGRLSPLFMPYHSESYLDSQADAIAIESGSRGANDLGSSGFLGRG